MRLLIITQKLDAHDSVLGFMHGWVVEFAKQVENVTVICLEKGQVNLPENGEVFSLGKEKTELGIRNYGLWKKVKYIWRFVRYIVQNRNKYDAVFVHMNPEYILIGGLFWKLWGKMVTLWYAHKSTPWFLRAALPFTNIVFTSTSSGFRLPSEKVKVVGQGIDIDRFKNRIGNQESGVKNGKGEFKVVTVGRITPAKDYDTLIQAIEKFRQNTGMPVRVDIFGSAALFSDDGYLKKLKERIVQKGLSEVVFFKGSVANIDLPDVLSNYDLFVNMGHTGSLDKAVPEAMAVGLPVLTCNEAFKAVLGPFTGKLMYPKGDFKVLAELIMKIVSMTSEERFKLGQDLRAIVVRDHSLKEFVKKIVSATQNHIHERK